MLKFGPPIIIPGRSCLLRITLLYKPDEKKNDLYIHLTRILFTWGKGINWGEESRFLLHNPI